MHETLKKTTLVFIYQAKKLHASPLIVANAFKIKARFFSTGEGRLRSIPNSEKEQPYLIKPAFFIINCNKNILFASVNKL